MRIHWSDLGVAGILVGAAGAVLYAGLQRSLRRAVAEQQASTDTQLAAMAATVRSLQMRVAELNRLAMERESAVAAIKSSQGNAQPSDALPQEMLAVITAAAVAFLGKGVRIRSARLAPVYQSGLLPVHASVSAWTQQGRMIVQASHNLRTRD